MDKSKLLDHLAPDAETRVTLARVLDKADYARRRNALAYTSFLTDGEQRLVQQALAAAGEPRRVFWGGYDRAERKICLFLPDWMEEFSAAGEEDPLAAVEITPPPDAKLTHRDYLGAMMGLGLTREVAGDILASERRCQAVCLKSVQDTLLTQWAEVGRYGVKVRAIALSALEPARGDVTLRRETFQSLRFDAVAAAGFGISRAKAHTLIAGGRISLNHLPCAKPDKLLEAGDSLTAKGLGKCVLARVTGESRKGRIMVEMERYR